MLRPLSVDPVVWPSIFSDDAVERPGWVGAFQDLWQSLDELLDAVGRQHLREFDATAVAAGYVASSAPVRASRLLEDRLCGILPDGSRGPEFETSPRSMGADWHLLGYDVADLFGLSGLSNCGHTEPEVELAQLRAEWGRHLNSFHLFSELQDAARFRDLVDNRVPEHAPFLVYGLWEVPLGGSVESGR